MRAQIFQYYKELTLILSSFLLFNFTSFAQNSNIDRKADNNIKSEINTQIRVIISSDIPPLDVIPGKAVKPGDPPEKCSDPDDVQSMVRLLLYSNDLEIEGLIASSGTFANIARKQNILDMLSLYEIVQPNLVKHDYRYPTAHYLRSVTWQGLDGSYGTERFDGKTKLIEDLIGKGKETEASEGIIKVVDEKDDRPVWVCVWGGSREIAQAIWTVQNTRSAKEFSHFISKLRIYLIAKQDGTADWLLNNHPDLFIILSENNYMGMFYVMDSNNLAIADLTWIEKNIRNNHGPLGAVYPRSGWDPSTPGVMEGDTPSFLHLVSALRGINNPETPQQGGWGGRFICPDPNKNHWYDDSSIGTKAVYMWRNDVQKEFEERADWMIP